MYPSDSNGCCSDPLAHTDPSFLLHAHFATDPSLSFFNFPSPCYNQCELEVLQDHGVFLQQDHDLLLHNQTLMAADSVSADTIINVPEVRQTPGKRSSSSKRERQSKINTANGPRDRRMRLSLDVAREFFGLQDMLGYDKASRTVQWLLMQARQGIKNLARTHVSMTNNSVLSAVKKPSSTLEGEVVSATEPKNMENKAKQQRPKTSFNPLVRDLRDKARARAKERTKAKQMWAQNPWEFGNIQQQAAVTEVQELGSQNIEHLRIHEDMIDESMAIINKWSPNSMLKQNPGIDQEHQLTGFLSFGKPWETYNNNNL